MTDFVVKVLQRKQLSHSQTDQKHFIYMHTKWLENATDLELLLTTSGTSYRATLKYDEIRKAAEELEQSYDDIYGECKTALTTQMGLPGFDYELDEQQVLFKLYKCTGYETIYLEVPLRKVFNSYQMLDAAMECAQQRQATALPNAAAEQENSSELANKHKEVLEEYTKFVKETEETKTIMLKKFLLLLNGKKKRIAQLEEQLKQQQGNDTDSDREMEELQVPDDDPDDDDDIPCFSGATQALTQLEK